MGVRGSLFASNLPFFATISVDFGAFLARNVTSPPLGIPAAHEIRVPLGFVALHCFVALHFIALRGCRRPPPRNAMQRVTNPRALTNAHSPSRQTGCPG